jgi:hypothetical protein
LNEIFHHQIRKAVLPSDVVKGADVRMAYTRDGAGLAFEAGDPRRIGRCENLDGNHARQARVARL